MCFQSGIYSVDGIMKDKVWKGVRKGAVREDSVDDIKLVCQLV